MDKQIPQEKLNQETFNQIYAEFLQIFNMKTEEDLVNHLIETNVPSKQVCAKILKKGTGAWMCKDCEKDSSCIMCNECYEKSSAKHANHKIYYKRNVSGCCDCGDPDSWDPRGFCGDHEGIFTSDKEVAEYNQKTFSWEKIEQIERVFFKLFDGLNQVLSMYEKGQDEDEQGYTNIIIEAVKKLDVLASCNLAVLHIIVEYFNKNFFAFTNHICFEIDTKKFIMTNNSHVCSCSFFQNLIRIWNKKFDKIIKIDKVLYTFLKSYKFKFLFAFSYLSLYDTIMINESEYLRHFSVQVITIEDISEKIVSSEDFMNNLFQKLFFLTNFYLENNTEQSKNVLYNIVFEFFVDICYTLKPKPAKIFSNYVNVFKILINILNLIQNRNKLVQATKFQYDGFDESFTTIEMYLLHLFSVMTTNFSFVDKESSDEILFHLIDKIKQSNSLLQPSCSKNEYYSFHIPLNRALGIYLNRYATYLSLQTNSDLFVAVKEILFNYVQLYNKGRCDFSLVPEYSFDTLLSDLVLQTVRFFGFINSVQCKFWVYYGENMLYYYSLYNTFDIFYLCDFTLVKLVLSQNYSGGLCNFQSLMQAMNVLNSYTTYMNGLFSDNKEISFETGSDLVKGQALFEKNISLLLKILRSENVFMDLFAFSYEKVRGNKNEDALLRKVLNEEVVAFVENVKTRIRHFVLERENSIYFSEILKFCPFYITDIFKHDRIEEILNSICDKVVSKNKPIVFKLKNEEIPKTDLSYIINPIACTTAEKFLIEFKKKEISLINTPILSNLKTYSNVDTFFIDNFYQNDNFLKKCVDLVIFFITKLSTKQINISSGLVLHIMKFIDIIITKKIEKTNEKYKNEKLTEFLNQTSSTGDELLDYSCKYLQMRITNEDMITNTNMMTDEDLRKLKAKELKEKYALQFKQKSQMFLNKNTTDIGQDDGRDAIFTKNGITLPLCEDIDDKVQLDCIICRNKINQSDFLSKGYGRIGTITSDSFLYHSKLQTIRKEYDRLVQLEDDQTALKDLMLSFKRNRPDLKKTQRFTTCNHFIHFQCYMNLVLKFMDKTNFFFPCPLCNSLSNIFIPHVDVRVLMDKFPILKGSTFAEMFVTSGEGLVSKSENDQFLSSVDYISLHSVTYFVEKIVSMNLNGNFIVSDFKKNPNRSYDGMLGFFINTLEQIEILKQENCVINNEVIRDFVFSMRILLRTNSIETEFFFTKLQSLLHFWTTDFMKDDELYLNLENDRVSKLLVELLFLIVLLLDESEFNYIKIVFKHVFPLLLIQFFILQIYIKDNLIQNNFEAFFKYDNILYIISSPQHTERLKEFVNSFLRKCVTVKNIFSHLWTKTTFSTIDEEYNYLSEQIGLSEFKGNFFDVLKPEDTFYPSFWPLRVDLKEHTKFFFDRCIQSKLSQESKDILLNIALSNRINPSLLLLNQKLDFEFIKLPNTLMQLTTRYINVSCPNCNSAPAFAILCLTCGEKICYTEICCKNFGKKKNEYEYKYHNKICGNGDGMFVQLHNGEVLFSLLGQFIVTKICLYTNKYGESVKERTIGECYNLSNETYEHLLKEFKNLSYKKYFLLNQNRYYAIEEDDL